MSEKENMKLSVFKRTGVKKSDLSRHRLVGEIPAVLYGARRKNENIYLKEADFSAHMRELKQGRLPTTVFELHYDKAVLKALIRDIQYHPTSYKVLHIDFGVIEHDLPVTVNVPIVIVNAAECAGVKLGGFIRQAVRSLKVSCMPQHIPSEFIVDVRNMNVADAKRLSDIELPKGVTAKAKMNEVAVVVAKRVG